MRYGGSGLQLSILGTARPVTVSVKRGTKVKCGTSCVNRVVIVTFLKMLLVTSVFTEDEEAALRK